METPRGRIATTHTGSLPRPPILLDTSVFDPSKSPPSDEQLTQAVREVVKSQIDAGVNIINDGEVSKSGYSTYITARLEGFGGSVPMTIPKDHRQFPEWAAVGDPEIADLLTNPACVGPVRYVSEISLMKDIETLQMCSREVNVDGVFMSAASPGVIAVFHKNMHYKTDSEYLWALADAMKHEYDAIHRSGLLLQLDCPDLAMGWNVADLGESADDFRRVIAERVEVINYATRNIPPEVMRLHVCWGNYEGPHTNDIPLREILEIVLRARPDGLCLEAANPRHEHEWKVFADVKLPEAKVLIPGVLDTTTNYVEHPDLVAERLVRFAQVVGRERLLAGTDCGFATFSTDTPVDSRIVWAKLAALADGARLASKELW
jgi:5-methyltetrahydropteroyltriglutamate--homocysteine methyltransferase